LKPITGRELCRLLEQSGWRLQRVKGSHYIYAKPAERKVMSIPVHGDQNLKPGLAARIARDTKLSW
jgi:predicted RNA binding protein YcfA (HicA-like mRNA interferase family)